MNAHVPPTCHRFYTHRQTQQPIAGYATAVAEVCSVAFWLLSSPTSDPCPQPIDRGRCWVVMPKPLIANKKTTASRRINIGPVANGINSAMEPR
jgi:hypothetical protein